MELSERTIRRDLVRAAKFLGTLSRSRDIWRVMARETGYTEADHDEGWKLYLAVMGYRPPTEAAVAEPTVQDDAIARLDHWDAPNFQRAQAALQRMFPDQNARLFAGLTPQRGAAAVGSVRTFLMRVDELRTGSEADQSAAALLATRRILDPATEAQLRAWINTATQGAAPAGTAAAPEEPAPDSAFMQAALGLHSWLGDWREQARQVFNRRDYLIRLGLASARTRAGASTEGDDEEDDDGESAA